MNKFCLDNFYTGNCVEIMNSFPGNSVDMVLTSPPYDNLRTYNGYDFDFESVAKQLYRIVRDGGVVVWVVNDATIDGDESGTSFKQALYFKELGFKLHDTMIWQKSNFANPSKTRYHQTFEYMFVFSKGKIKTFNPIKDRVNKYKTNLGRNSIRKANGDIIETEKKYSSEFGMRHNVWQLNTVGQEMMCKTPPHPAMFPESLAKDHILSWSNPGDVVLDPMCGSGTTCKMAYKLGRKFIGIDISEDYIKIAQQRIKE